MIEFINALEKKNGDSYFYNERWKKVVHDFSRLVILLENP